MGWNDWDALHLAPNVGPAVGSPVTVSGRALKVLLPATMTSKQFDAAFDHSVGLGALAPWLLQPEGKRHCELVGFNPETARRLTGYRYDATSRFKPVREIAVFRPRSDADRLIEIVERIILQHLVLSLERFQHRAPVNDDGKNPWQFGALSRRHGLRFENHAVVRLQTAEICRKSLS